MIIFYNLIYQKIKMESNVMSPTFEDDEPTLLLPPKLSDVRAQVKYRLDYVSYCYTRNAHSEKPHELMISTAKFTTADTEDDLDQMS